MRAATDALGGLRSARVILPWVLARTDTEQLPCSSQVRTDSLRVDQPCGVNQEFEEIIVTAPDDWWQRAVERAAL